MDFKRHIAKKLNIEGIGEDELVSMLSLPPNTEMGDFALPCFKFAKIFRKSPALIAEEIAKSVSADEFVSEVSAVNGYVNFKIDRDFWAKETLSRVLSEKERYGSSDRGNGQDRLHRLFLRQHRQALSYRAPFDDRSRKFAL